MITALVVALYAEARPLIDHFRLKALAHPTLFPIWSHDTVVLIISGVGKIQAAAAVSYLAGIYRDEPIDSWLNIGIAGHRSLPIGTPTLVHKITDASRNISFFPSFAFVPTCATYPCLTVDQPTNAYPEDALCEMEGSGFYPLAAKIAPLETIHLFKVISDNRDNSSHNITKKQVETLIGAQVGPIDAVIAEMCHLAKDLMPHDVPLLDVFLKKWHFTTCQTQNLKKALQRWHVLFPDQVILSQDMLSCPTADSVLALLEQKLTNCPLPLS